jgi:hypothetical protein
MKDRANALLLSHFSDAPTLPTIQALLILAGRELALGYMSAGWLKSGMAFRMIEEMDLERDASIDLGAVAEEQRETVYLRQRIYWSAYSWDK